MVSSIPGGRVPSRCILVSALLLAGCQSSASIPGVGVPAATISAQAQEAAPDYRLQALVTGPGGVRLLPAPLPPVARPPLPPPPTAPFVRNQFIFGPPPVVPPVAPPPVAPPPVAPPPVAPPPVAPPPVAPPPVAPPPVAPPPVVPPPAATPGNFTLVVQGALVKQFNVTRNLLRIDCPGDVAAGAGITLDSMGPGATANPATVQLKATGDIRLAGTNTSIFGGPISTGVMIPPVPLIPGEVLAGGAGALAVDSVSVIWPSLNPAEVPGPPIVRLQLGAWTASIGIGTALDVNYTINQVDATGAVLNSWNGAASGLIVP